MNPLSPEEEKAVEDFKRRLQTRFGSDLLGLRIFGSRARAEGNEESDLDVLVLLKDAPAPIRGIVFEMAADIFLQHEIDVSPLVMSRDHFESMKRRERLLARDIERDGIPV